MTRGEPTGQTKTWSGDVVATAKRDLEVGEKLDGEGGHTVYGRLMPAEDSMAISGLPIGLAHGWVLKKPVKKDQRLSWDDIEFTEKAQAVAIRKEMEALFKAEFNSKKVNGVHGTHV